MVSVDCIYKLIIHICKNYNNRIRGNGFEKEKEGHGKNKKKQNTLSPIFDLILKSQVKMSSYTPKQTRKL